MSQYKNMHYLGSVTRSHRPTVVSNIQSFEFHLSQLHVSENLVKTSSKFKLTSLLVCNNESPERRSSVIDDIR